MGIHVTLTREQQDTIARLKKEWMFVEEPSPSIGGDYVMVHVHGRNGNGMWIGIEQDGHAHS